MNEQQLFELLGRKQAQLEVAVADANSVRRDYINLLAVVKTIKEGKANLDRLTITDQPGWRLEPAEDNPEQKPKKK